MAAWLRNRALVDSMSEKGQVTFRKGARGGGALLSGLGPACQHCGVQHGMEPTPDKCIRLLARRVKAIERVLSFVGGKIRPCAYCGTPMVGKSKSAEYCRAACRTSAYKIRHDLGPDARLCDWPPCKQIIADRNKNARFCSRSCKGKMAHHKRRAKLLQAIFDSVRRP